MIVRPIVCRTGGRIRIDATRKIPGEGIVRAWPEKLEMSEETLLQVESRWAEYEF